MKRKNNKERELTGTAPKSHRELVKEAKENLISPKEKWKCDVFFEVQGKQKKQYEIRKRTKHLVKVAQLRHSHKNKDRLVTFGEITKIKII